MAIWSSLRRLWRDLVHRGRVENDLIDELRAFVDEQADRYRQVGLEPAEARRQALAEIGGLEPMTRQLRDQRRSIKAARLAESVVTDIRYGLRSLVRTPRFSIPAVLALGLGIAIATGAFGLVNALMLRPAPVKDGSDLVVLAARRPTYGTLRNLSYPNYVDLRESDAFRGLVGYARVPVRWRDGPESFLAQGQAVSGNYFDVFGVAPFLGRILTPGDDVAGASPAVVVSRRFWTTRLAGGAVVGRTIQLSGRPFVVVGVVAEGFRGTDPLFAADVWLPITQAAQVGLADLTGRAGSGFHVQGFVRDGITKARAQRQIDALTATLRDRYPVEDRDLRTLIVPERDTRPIIDADTAGKTAVAALFLGIATIGLLIDGASVISLVLARALSRRREISLRLALGATRRRVVQQLLVESLIVSLVGSAFAWLLTTWLLAAASTHEWPGGIVIDLSPDRAVFAFTVFLAIVVGVLVGLSPALAATRADLRTALAEGGHVTSAGRLGRLRERVVAGQFSALTLLLVVMGLFVGSVRSAAHVDPGFQTKDRLLFTLSPEDFRYDEHRGRDLVERLEARVRALPGVESVASVYEPPLGFASSSMEVAPQDRRGDVPSTRVACTVVTPGYFSAIGVPIVRGRVFQPDDRDLRPRVAVINDTLAKAFWPGEDALGKRLVVPLENREHSFEVVGIVKTGKYASLNEAPRSFLWVPYAQQYRGSMTLVVHARGDSGAMAAAVRRSLAEIDPVVSLSDVMPFEELVHVKTVGSEEAGAAILGGLGILGIIRATFGLYGLLSYFTVAHVREIGIRLALGATGRSVARLVMGRGLTLAVRGVAMGLVLGWIAARLLHGIVGGLGSPGAVTYLGVPVLLAVATLLAGYLPVRRLLRSNPVAALRQE